MFRIFKGMLSEEPIPAIPLPTRIPFISGPWDGTLIKVDIPRNEITPNNTLGVYVLKFNVDIARWQYIWQQG